MNNLGQRYFTRIPFEASPKAFGHLFRGVRSWLKLELKTAFTKPVPALETPASVTMTKPVQTEPVSSAA